MSDFHHNTFAEWLRHRRRQRALTQSDLAELIGCSVALVQKMERGERRPSRQVAALLAERLAIPPDRHTAFLAFARDLEQRAPEGDPTPPPAPTAILTPMAVADTPLDLIGREAVIAQLCELLARSGVRLISIVGPGGVGKTLLAREIARRQASATLTGFVELEAITNPLLIAGAILDALRIPRQGAVPALTQLSEVLRNQSALLVLDNLEQLLVEEANTSAITAEFVRDLLDRIPDVQVVVTSREPLRLSDEWVFTLDSLPLPSDPPTSTDVAVALFLARMQRVAPHHQPSPENLRAIAQICRMVDGLPLAIELAAAWTAALSPAEVAQELARSPDLLSHALRDAPVRHRSMQAVFQQSWQLLSPRSAAVLSRLALLPGGVDRESAAYVARAALPQLGELVQKSLLRRSEGGRYTLHPIVRYYSARQLSPIERLEAQQRVINYALAFAVEASAGVNSGEQQRRLAEIASEYDNMRAALQMSLELPGFQESGARICTALRRFWAMRGFYREGLTWVEQFLQRGPYVRELQVRLLVAASHLARMLGDFARAIDAGTSAVALVAEQQISFERGEAFFCLGSAYYDAGDPAACEPLIREALDVWRVLDNLYEQVTSLNNLANAVYDLGDPITAKTMFAEGLSIARRSKFIIEEGLLLMNLGFMQALEGAPEAGATCASALPILLTLGNHHGAAFALEAMAADLGRKGRRREATLLFGAAETIRITIDAPVGPANQAAYERFRTLALGSIPADDQERLLLEGRRMQQHDLLNLVAHLYQPDTV